MAMDFFAQQELARRNTRRLILLYAVAVALIILAIYVVVALLFQKPLGEAYGYRQPTHTRDLLFDYNTELVPHWYPEVFLGVAGGVLLIVFAGTAYKIRQLSGGGTVVAEMLGGRPIHPGTTDPGERRLLNIMEEMAIASGIPMPRAYVLPEESGINAFAAGHDPRDAVVAVTRGALQKLNRDELQGVVGHEFSHLLNGDMRLNIRLIGVLNGILVIALVGYFIMRSLGRSSSGRGKKGGGAAVILLLGLALLIIGYIGVFFAKLIKAAVSRQREFLADAAAVQFTRFPPGLAGALKKIGGSDTRSFLHADHAAEASHLFFANGLGSVWFNLFATHPPIFERVRRLDPAFDGRFPTAAPDLGTAAESADRPPVLTPAQVAALAGALAGGTRAPIPFQPQDVMPQVGLPLPEHLNHASQLLASLPGPVTQAARDPAAAPNVVYGLLLHADAAIREKQFGLLAGQAGEGTVIAVKDLVPLLDRIPAAARLPLAQIILPALRLLAPEAKARLLAVTEALVNADAEVDLFEYMLRRMLARQLTSGVAQPQSFRLQRRLEVASLLPLVPACQRLLSTLAWLGTNEPANAQAAFRAAVRELIVSPAPEFLPAAACGLSQVDTALSELERATPVVKKRILAACVACISADAVATIEEAELLRAVADALDCPIPPLSATRVVPAAA